MYLCDGGVGSNVSEADMKAPQVKHYIPLIPIANILDSIPTIMPTDNTCSLCLSPHILPAGTRCCKNKYICLMCWCEYLKAGHRRCPLCCQVDSFMAGVKNLAVFVHPPEEEEAASVQSAGCSVACSSGAMEQTRQNVSQGEQHMFSCNARDDSGARVL